MNKESYGSEKKRTAPVSDGESEAKLRKEHHEEMKTLHEEIKRELKRMKRELIRQWRELSTEHDVLRKIRETWK